MSRKKKKAAKKLALKKETLRALSQGELQGAAGAYYDAGAAALGIKGPVGPTISGGCTDPGLQNVQQIYIKGY